MTIASRRFFLAWLAVALPVASSCNASDPSHEPGTGVVDGSASATTVARPQSTDSSVWDVRWSVVSSDSSGSNTTVDASATMTVTVGTQGEWLLSLVVNEAQTEGSDRWRMTAEPAWMRARVDENGQVTALELDLASELTASPTLVHLLGDLALVSASGSIDSSLERTGFGGIGRVRAIDEGWVREAYSAFLYAPGQEVRVVESRILAGPRQGGVTGLHLRETVVAEEGQAFTLTLTVGPSTGGVGLPTTPVWHALDTLRPMADLVQTTQDLERAADLDGEALLARLLQVLPHGEVGEASSWITPIAARLRLSPELADRVAEQTMAHLRGANGVGLARVVDALIASRTPEAERALRRMFDDPEWASAPDGLATMQHLALFEDLSVETLDWALAQAVNHPDATRRLMATSIASSAMWSLRESDRRVVHEAGSRLMLAYAGIDDPDMQIRWLRVLSNAGEPRFLRLADDAIGSDDEERRAAGYRLFRRVNTPDSLATLLAAVHDPSDRVLERALQALSDHAQFAEQREAVQMQLLEHLGREPTARWFIAQHRNAPLSPGVCLPLVRGQGLATVPDSLMEAWNLLIESCGQATHPADVTLTP